MEIVMRKTDELIPYVNNARKNDNAVDAVASSIKNYGFKQPIVIDGQGEVVAGHTRLKAAKKLGLKEVPVIIADDLTPAQVKAYRIADNRVGELAEWDMELLQLEMADIEGFTGFEDLELPNEAEKANDDDFDAEKELEQIEEPITQRGWIYKLGNHRLMCGDSTSEEDVKRLMDEKYADCVFTDPPYLINSDGANNNELQKSLKKQHKSIEFINNFNPKKFLECIEIVFNKNFNSYIFCNKELLPDYLLWARDKKLSFNVLIWKKPNAIPIGDSHRPDIEYLILFRKNAIWNNGLKDVNYSRCLEYGRETGLHPTMKPIDLIVNELKISSNKGSIVVDFFGGSGSTMIACENINRHCYMIELEPKYCDVIVKRWENMTGQKAERIE
jgi:DNA modification methylase